MSPWRVNRVTDLVRQRGSPVRPVQAAVRHEPTCRAGTPPAQRSRQPPGSTPGRRVMTPAAGTSRGRSTLPSAGPAATGVPASRPSPLHSQPPAVTLSSPGPAAGPAHTPRSRAFAISDNNRRRAPAPISRILFSPANCGTSVAVNVLVTLPAPEPLISCRTPGSGGGRGAVTAAWNEDDHAGGTRAGKLPRDSLDWECGRRVACAPAQGQRDQSQNSQQDDFPGAMSNRAELRSARVRQQAVTQGGGNSLRVRPGPAKATTGGVPGGGCPAGARRFRTGSVRHVAEHRCGSRSLQERQSGHSVFVTNDHAEAASAAPGKGRQ